MKSKTAKHTLNHCSPCPDWIPLRKALCDTLYHVRNLDATHLLRLLYSPPIAPVAHMVHRKTHAIAMCM